VTTASEARGLFARDAVEQLAERFAERRDFSEVVGFEVEVGAKRFRIACASGKNNPTCIRRFMSLY